jgi:transcriptional regulator with XRE-family HTH domain
MGYKKKKSVPLGENLRLMREDSDLEQEELGSKVGMTQQQISYLERSTNSKVGQYIKVVEKVFDCVLEDLATYHKTRFLKKDVSDKENDKQEQE